MKVFDKLFILFIVMVLIVFLYQTFAEAEETMYVNVEFGSYLNAREWPNPNANLIGRLDRGLLVIVTETDGDYSRVTFVKDNSSGWVMTKYLSTTKPEELPVGTYVIASDCRVAVRKEANTNAKKVLWKYPGDELTVLSWVMQDNVLWAKVKGGYIMGKYLELPIDSEKQE
jgi:hypothetical protein